MTDCIIPPWVRPESPETLRIIDDATLAFAPAFGRGTTQRGIWADPRWGLRRRYRGLRSDEKAAILNALNETRGQLNVLRVTPHTPLRGSFSTSELITNGTFPSGTTGWQSSNGTQATISAADRTLRITRLATSAVPFIKPATPAVTVTQYAPYVARAFFRSGRGRCRGDIRLGATDEASDLGFGAYDNITSTIGLMTATGVALTTSIYPGIGDYASNGSTAAKYPGDYVDVQYVSLTRCLLIDAGANMLVRSEEFDNASWTKTNTTVSANTAVSIAPDASSNADNIVETTANGVHSASQAATVTSTALDYTFAVAVKINGRSHCWLQMSHGTGSSFAFFNLTTGAVGSTSTGSGWSNLRTFTVDIGNGWFYVCIVARKTSADISITSQLGAANGDGVSSYAGSTSAGVLAWRATFAQSAVPMQLTSTSSTALPSGSTVAGSTIQIKGGPASASGVLLSSDWVEIGGELKMITAKLDTNAAGMGTLSFRPTLAGAPADNDPVVVFEPFGRFIYPAGAREIENQFGIYGDCTMDLEEVYV